MRYDGKNLEALDIAVAEVGSAGEVGDTLHVSLGKVALVVAEGSTGHELFELVEEMREEEHNVVGL